MPRTLIRVGLFVGAHCVAGSAQPASLEVGCGPTRAEDLVAAIASANATAEDDTILLTTPGCVYTLTAPENATDGGNGLPVVANAASAGRLTIEGSSATLARDSDAASFRLLQVAAGGELTLRGLTLTGGETGGDGPGEDGGARNLGTLTVHRCSVTDNAASSSGGGLYNRGTLRVLDSTVAHNESGTFGGGIASWDGAAILTNTTITGNRAATGGGVYLAEAAPATFTHGSIVANHGNFAGGIRGPHDPPPGARRRLRTRGGRRGRDFD